MISTSRGLSAVGGRGDGAATAFGGGPAQTPPTAWDVLPAASAGAPAGEAGDAAEVAAGVGGVSGADGA
jgi:hypothetical protein